jgi:Na+/pantothenate symporter
MELLSILGIALAFGIKFLVEPRMLSRFYGLKDRSALRMAAVIAPLLILVTYVALLPVGAFAHALIPADAIKSTDKVIPHLLSGVKVFGPVFSSLFLLVLMSAAMSSIDSVLLVAASSVDHDLINPGIDDARAVARTRIWVVVISLASVCAALMPWAEDIVTVTALSGSLYGACFLAPLVVGLFWRRAGSTAAMSSMIVGGLTVIAWFIAKRQGWTHLHEVFVGLAVGLTIYIVVGLLTAPPTRNSMDHPDSQ